MTCIFSGITVAALCNQLPAEHRLLIEKLIKEQSAGERCSGTIEKFVFEVLVSHCASILARLPGGELRDIILRANSSGSGKPVRHVRRAGVRAT